MSKMSSTQCSTHNDSMDQDSSHGGRQLTQGYLKDLFKREWKLYRVTKIEGLEQNVKLRSLYLQENLIEKMEGLETLEDLYALNLSDNIIQKVEGLANLKKIGKSLNSNNDSNQLQLQAEGQAPASTCLDDLLGLLECPSVSVLDISDNFIDDPAIVEEILQKMPKLAVLYLQGNPVCKKIQNYRKTLIVKIPTLKYLDDKPVFDEDRRFAEAWSRGGIQEERTEREKFKQEKEEAHWKNHEAFQDMIKRAREEKKKADEDAKKKAEEEALTKQNQIHEEQIKDEEVFYLKAKLLEQSPQQEAPQPDEEEQDQNVQEEKLQVQQVQQEEDDQPPELEQVDLEQLRLQSELEQAKAQKQKEWLLEVTQPAESVVPPKQEEVVEEEAKVQEEPFIPWDESCDLPKPDEEAIQKRTELLMSQQQPQPTEEDIEEIKSQAQEEEEVEQDARDYTDFEELD